jgi:hypothetical protein
MELCGCTAVVGRKLVEAVCKYREMGTDEDPCEWMKGKTEAEAKARSSIVNGKLVQLYIERALQMVATSNNAHVCTSECRLLEIQGECFQLPDPDLVHVHLTHPVVYCNAPFHAHGLVHSGTRSALRKQVYVCVASGKAHVCTEWDCDADTMETEAGMCCVLTGNVIGVNRRLYRHEWMEDERYSGAHRRGPTDAQKAHRAKSSSSENGRVMEALRRLADRDLDGSVATDAHAAARALLVQKAADVIGVLFPGSAVRTRLENEQDTQTTRALYAHYWRYVKSCTDAGRPVMLDALHSATRALTKCDELRSCRPRIQMSQVKVQVIARGYARGVVQQLRNMLIHTDYRVDSLPAYVNFVIAALYMQQHRFCIQGVDIFPGDAFLESMLPKQPSTLIFYTNGIKPTLTTTKNAVKKHVAEAIATGKALPLQLQCPHLPYADVFL